MIFQKKEETMRSKSLIVLLLVISIAFLLYIVKNSYSQPPAGTEVIQPDEIAKTLEDVKQKPTTNETFDKRIKVIEAWIVLSIMAGDREELRQAVPPGVIQNIARLKTEGKENEALKMLDELFMSMEKIGLPKRLESAPRQQDAGQGRCGDGTCDDFEKSNPNLCPQDCEAQKKASQPMTSALKPAKPITAKITIDYSNFLGTFSPYVFGATSDPKFNEAEYPRLKDVGFKMVDVIAPPMPLNSSDINNPSKYNFTIPDKQIETLINVGAIPMLWFPLEKKPSNLNDYATYVINVVRHFNQGWGNGYKWNVKVFRFGNEPDNPEFWKGSQQEWFEAYAAGAKALKKMDPNFILNTFGIMDFRVKSGSPSNWPTNSPSNWLINFLTYAKNNNVPVDYVSIHGYAPLPHYMFYENFKLLQEELNKYPTLSNLYGAPRPSNDEWDIMLGDLWSGSYGKQFDTAWAASLRINALVNMIEQGLQFSLAHTGASNRDCHDFLLIDCKGNKKSSYYAFKGFNWLYGADRLSTTGTDHANFAAIAGRKDNVVIVVISNYDVEAYLNKYENKGSYAWIEYDTYIKQFGQPKTYNKYNIALKNLPWTSSQQVVYERYLVDDTNNLALVETQAITGDKTLTFTEDITAPLVQVIKVYVK